MHVRLSSVRGAEILDEQTQYVVATLDDPLIHPDTGKIEGFFVYGYSVDAAGELFLPAHDILSWGTSIHIRSATVLCSPGEIVRLQQRLQDPRQFLGQRIHIENTKKFVGVCADVQFDTRHLVVEWLFPKKFFWYRQPLSATDIVEVTPEAIVVRDPVAPIRGKISEKFGVDSESDLMTEIVPSPQVRISKQ